MVASAETASTDCCLQRIYGEKTLSKREMFLSCALLASDGTWGKGRSTAKELAKRSKYCDKSVSRILASLENKGYLIRRHGKSPDTRKTVTVFQLRLPDERPDEVEVLSEETSRSSDILSGVPTEPELSSPNNGQISTTELKDLEPQDPEPEDLDPEGQKQGQNPMHSDNRTHVQSPRRQSKNLPRKVMELYRLLCSDLPPAGRLSAKRIRAVQALTRKFPQGHSPDWWESYFTRAAGSSFLGGSGPRGWQADLDWLLVPANAQKVLAGNYDDHSPSRPRDAEESLDSYVDRMVAFMERASSR